MVRPGGTVGMTAWTKEGFTAELFELGRSYAPPSDQPLSDEWSVEENVRERFDGLAARFELEQRELVWEADSPEALVAMLGTSAPPWVARQAEPAAGALGVARGRGARARPAQGRR